MVIKYRNYLKPNCYATEKSYPLTNDTVNYGNSTESRAYGQTKQIN